LVAQKPNAHHYSLTYSPLISLIDAVNALIIMMLPSTRISMMIVMVITILVATCCIPSTATIIDLSKDLPEDTAAMKFSEGAKAMEQAATAEPNIRAAIVMEKGKIVSSYYREDVNPSDSSPVFSATKSWMGLLIGLLVDDGLLSVHQTLGEIFTEDEAWTDVTDGVEEFRKNVTIKDIRTHNSTSSRSYVYLSWHKCRWLFIE
jgi:CubicO group peptidase (beta-lactamase class C family)